MALVYCKAMPLKFNAFLSAFLLTYGGLCTKGDDNPDQPTAAEYKMIENVYNDGDYQNQKFMGINTQFSGSGIDVCEDNYVKCLVSIMNLPTPICAYHTSHYPKGQFTFPSYCDMFFENCRRGMRYWRLLGYGVCHYSGILGKQFNIVSGDIKGNVDINITRRWLDDWWNLQHYYEKTNVVQ